MHPRTDSNGYPDTMPWRPLPHPTHLGITRNPRERTAPVLPVTEAQAEVLALLTHEVQRAKAIADALGRSPAGVTSSLYGLQERKLAERVYGKGWKRPDA